MIHNSLLPVEEVKALRHEYRTRVFIIASFFISCGIALGIISLIPSYLISYVQEHEVRNRELAIEESRKQSGIDEAEKNLLSAQNIAKRMNVDADRISYIETISRIISHRSQAIKISSFEIYHALGTTTPYSAKVQGKAATRDALLAFKQGLEGDAAFAKVDLPLSDLAKSSDISFALDMTLKDKP